jgi:S-adenosylmethionine synthetase
VFDLRPAKIIESLGLKKPIYRQTAFHGHFGRPSFSWEATSKVAELTEAVSARAR